MGQVRLGLGRGRQFSLTFLWMLMTILILRSAVQNEASSIASPTVTPSPDEPQVTTTSHDTATLDVEEQIQPSIEDLTESYFEEELQSSFDEDMEPPIEDLRPTLLSLVAPNAAVILETRQSSKLVPLMLHFAGVLGPTWPIILYTTLATAAHYASSNVLSRMEDQIEVRILPDDTDISTHDSISAFLTKAWFWESLAPASRVLVFQSDSIICSNSDVDINDFLQYDFVGAPIASGLGRGFNGGLSLRNREKMLEVIRDHDWQKEHTDVAEGEDVYNDRYEDQWFVEKLKGLPHSKLPSAEEAQSFAVETIWNDKTLGFHQLHRWQPTHVEEVEQWCPELKLITGGAFA